MDNCRGEWFLNIALVSTRFLRSDMRGSEETTRLLFQNISPKHKITVLSSDAMGSLNSIYGKFIYNNREDTYNDERVHYIRSYPSMSTLPFYGSYLIINLFSRMGLFPYSQQMIDLLRIYGWGPYIPGLKNYLRREKFDVVHASTFPTTSAFLSMKYSQKYQIPFVFTPFYHYRRSDFKESILLSSMIKRSQAVIACTEIEKSELIKIGGSAESIHVVPLAFDSQIPLKYGYTKSKAREELGIAEDSFVVLIYPWKEKGGVAMLKALYSLSESFPNITILTIGDCDRDYMKAKNQIKQTTLRHIDLGWVSNGKKWAAFNACDAFGMPSLSDAFGISYLNAWSVERPVIAASNTSASEIVENGINGFLVDQTNIKSILDALELMATDTKLTTQMGKKGNEKLKLEYSPKKMSYGYTSVFESVT